jgi:hypothetical protein
VAQCTTTFLAIARYGFGEIEFDAVAHANLSSWKRSLYIGEMLYILCIGVSKTATAIFLGRLSQERKQNITGLTLAGSSLAWMLGSVLAVGIRGNLSEPWFTVPNVCGIDSLKFT